MILVTHFACCHQYKGYWRSCPLGWSYFTVMPGLNLRAGGAHAPEFTAIMLYYFEGMTDVEIGKLFNTSRSTIQYRRTSSFEILKKYLEEHADEWDEW